MPDPPGPPGHVLLHNQLAGSAPPLAGQVDPPGHRLDEPEAGQGSLGPALVSMKVNLKEKQICFFAFVWEQTAKLYALTTFEWCK